MRMHPNCSLWLTGTLSAWAWAAIFFGVGRLEAQAEGPGIIVEDPLRLVDEDFFLRGDATTDGELDIGDAQRTLNFLFSGGAAPGCLKAADTNDDGSVELVDAVALLNFLFLGAAPPAVPHLVCGVDLVPDALSCAETFCASVGAFGVPDFRVVRHIDDCRQEPCMDRFLAEALETGEFRLSNVTFDHLRDENTGERTGRPNPSAMEANFQSTIRLKGLVQDGPAGPGGIGRTLVILGKQILVDPRADLSLSARADDPVLVIDGPVTRSSDGSFQVPIRLRVRSKSDENLEGQEVHCAIKRGDTTIHTWSFSTLSAGSSKNLTAVLDFPGAESGAWVRLTGHADVNDVLDEVYELNNTSEALSFILQISAPDPGPIAQPEPMPESPPLPEFFPPPFPGVLPPPVVLGN